MVIDLILAISLPVVLWTAVIVYGFGSPFHKHMTGIGLFSILTTFATLMTISLLQAMGLFHHNITRVVYVLAILSVSVMTYIIAHEQHLGRRDEIDKKAAAQAAVEREGD